MTLEVSAGRIYVVDDTNGDVMFDTDERMFVPTDYVAGTHTTPQRQASAVSGSRTDVNIDVDTTLASINASADAIFGAFKVTVSGFTPMGAGGWFIASGSYLHGQFTMGNTNENHTTTMRYIAGHVVYTFRASGGFLIFNERAFMRATLTGSATPNTSTMPATTIDYKLYCGSFV